MKTLIVIPKTSIFDCIFGWGGDWKLSEIDYITGKFKTLFEGNYNECIAVRNVIDSKSKIIDQ
jgi:hypothetical protein